MNRPSTPSRIVPPVVARRRSIQAANLDRTTLGVETRRRASERARRGRSDDAVPHDPEADGVQVRGGPGQRALDGLGQLGAVDALPGIDAEAFEDADDHEAVDDQHPAHAGDGAPAVAAERDGRRSEDDPADDPDEGNRLDDVVELPDVELVGAPGDIGQAPAQPGATGLGGAARRPLLEAGRDQRERIGEVQPARTPRPSTSDWWVWRMAVRKIERNVSVSTTASTARIAAGRKAMACSFPARASCSVRRSATSRRTDEESRSCTVRRLNVALS